MKQVKILHIVSVTPVGGVGSYLKNVLKYINKNKYFFSFVICDKPSDTLFSSYVKEFGCPVYYAGPLDIKNLIHIRIWFKRFFKEHKYDIVEIHSANLGFLCASYSKKYGEAKTVFHFHSTKYSTSKIKGMRNYIIELPLVRWGDYYIACGEAVAEEMIKKRGIDCSKYKVIQNAIGMERKEINAEKISEIRNKYTGYDGKICLAVGNCVGVKNYMFLLRVFKEIESNFPSEHIALLIAGDGEERKKIEEFIYTNKMRNVHLLGYRDDVPLLMECSDMLVMPSLYEGLPLTIIEAQVYGLPVLLSDSITKEVGINSNVYYLDLESGARNWADSIVRTIHMNKVDSEKILRSKFNIENQIIIIQNTYNILYNSKCIHKGG